MGQAGRTTTGSSGWRIPNGVPRSLAHLKRSASEKKWPEIRSWCERRQPNRGYVLWKNGKPNPAPARAEERTASQFYQLKSACAFISLVLSQCAHFVGRGGQGCCH